MKLAASDNGENIRGPHQFMRIAEPAHGRAHQDFAAAFSAGQQVRVQRSGDAGRDGIHANSITRPLARQAAR